MSATRRTPRIAPQAVRSIKIDSWAEFRELAGAPEYRSWAFRGQGDASWPLFSSLSRQFLIFAVHRDAWVQQESRILRIFRRKAHLLLQHLPPEDDAFEWLALMQHYGAPTRLLDFSWSPFVAAFFALERATTDAAVWAFFPPGINSRRTRTLRPSQKIKPDEVGPWIPGSYEEHFLPNAHELAVIGEPHRMNQRLIAQSGTFVMPGVLHKPLEELVPSDCAVKFILQTSSLRREALADLYNMNISNATLFPGLDGLARSLAFELEHHWAFDPVTMEKWEGYELE